MSERILPGRGLGALPIVGVEEAGLGWKHNIGFACQDGAPFF